MSFFERVYNIVKNIPRGKVATYRQIAALVSTPRAARQVGYALRNLPEGSRLPWQRVINAQGMISIENMSATKQLQARRLQEDGIEVEFRDGNYWVDLEKYLWKPN